MGFEVHVALWRKSVLNFGKPFSFISVVDVIKLLWRKSGFPQN